MMNRWLLLLAGVIFGFHLEAQVFHRCPLHSMQGGGYENPLNEKWLSAYDVKFYDLQLRVYNTSTEIYGVATVLLEAVRELDTVVLELQDALDVMGIELGETTDDPDFTAVPQFSHLADAIFISLDKTYMPGDLLAVRIEYGGEAGQDRGFFAGITTDKDFVYGFDVTYTLSEPLNAKDWFPVK